MKWIKRLKDSFGFPFLLLVFSIYWTQGFRALPWMAVSYQMKDELELSPSASQFLMSTAFLPWSVKPLYGIFSDCVPIFGRRRTPYMVISSVLCFVTWLVLGTVDAFRSSFTCLMVILTLQNVGAAMADVVVDAMVAESARQERAEFAGDLQSLSWLAMAFGGILGSICGGVALKTLEVKGIFVLFSVFPAVQLLSCLLVDDKSLVKAIEESPTTTDYTSTSSHGDAETTTAGRTSTSEEDEDWVRVEAAASHKVTTEAGSSSGASAGLRRRNVEADEQTGAAGSLEEERKVHDERLVAALKNACLSLFQAVKQPAIFKPMLWFFISQSMIPNLSSSIFYYQTNFLKLDASFLGTSRVVGWGGLMIGTFMYNRHLKRVSLRKLFSFVHVVLALLTLTDILLVSRLNSHLGIPDRAFVLGASALGDAVMQFKFMPFLVFSGQICPPGIEGTLFALFMSINNLGSTVSSFAGASLASALGITSDEFGNLGIGILVQAVFTIIPVFFIFLVPGRTATE